LNEVKPIIEPKGCMMGFATLNPSSFAKIPLIARRRRTGPIRRIDAELDHAVEG
jgi:hypothetical protein